MSAFFDVEREEILDELEWSPSDDRKPYFFECRPPPSKPPVSGAAPGQTFQEGFLEHDEVQQWLEQKGKFKPVGLTRAAANKSGGVRLLIVDGVEFPDDDRDWCLYLKREDYESLERALHLHPATLTGFYKSTGVCTSFKQFNPETGDLRRVSTILRPSNIWQRSIFALSQTYDISTHQTTALMVGYGLIGEALEAQTDFIKRLLETNSALWNHPNLLSNIFLQAYRENYRDDVLNSEGKTTELEGTVGATSYWKWTETAFEGESITRSKTWQTTSSKNSKASKRTSTSISSDPLSDWPASVDVKASTLSIHFHASAMYEYLASVKWHRDSIQFLLDLQTRTERRFLPEGRLPAEWEDMRDIMEYQLQTTEQMVQHLLRLQQRVQTQTNVLYSAASQKDNLVASRIASSTKKDSIAMMAFTFITALFLPGTYIASVFSTGMFNWMPENLSDGGRRVVSTRFWIYWVVTLPLTFAVMAGWYLWYRAADAEWRKTTQLEVNAKEDADEEAEPEEKDPAELEQQIGPSRNHFQDRWRMHRSSTTTSNRVGQFSRSMSDMRERSKSKPTS